jgi:hypothetical protein
MSNKYEQTKEYFIAYSILIGAAQHHGLATYQEIVWATGLPKVGSQMAHEIGLLLACISENEKKQGRPMLSTLAVGVSGAPGEGFLPWARQLGFLADGMDEQAFWGEECQKVYAEWKIKYK